MAPSSLNIRMMLREWRGEFSRHLVLGPMILQDSQNQKNRAAQYLSAGISSHRSQATSSNVSKR